MFENVDIPVGICYLMGHPVPYGPVHISTVPQRFDHHWKLSCIGTMANRAEQPFLYEFCNQVTIIIGNTKMVVALLRDSPFNISYVTAPYSVFVPVQWARGITCK